MEPLLGQIEMFAGNFAPRGWAFCDGQLLPINSNQSLYSLLGTTYGGDGRTSFALPDMRGRAPMHHGNGPGLSSKSLGEKGGQETHTLTVNELAAHTHTFLVSNQSADNKNPVGDVLARPAIDIYHNTADAAVNLKADTISHAGGGQAHGNEQPFQVVNFIIATQGTFPSRN